MWLAQADLRGWRGTWVNDCSAANGGDRAFQFARRRVGPSLLFRRLYGTLHLQAAVEQPRSQFGAPAHVGFLVHLVEMFVHGFDADAQALGDLQILVAAQTFDGDLSLALGKPPCLPQVLFIA